MRRSVHLTVTVVCPHFEKPVAATKNDATGRLVDCSDKDRCAKHEEGEGGVTIVVRPAACPVFVRRG